MMNRLRLLMLFGAVAVIGGVGGHRAGAFSFFQVNGSVVVWFGGQSTRLLSPTTFPPDSATDLLYRSSMGLWNLVPAAAFEYSFARNEQDFEIDNFDGYSDTIAVAASSLDPGTLGVTFLVNSGSEWFDIDQVYADLPNNVGWSMALSPTCEMVADPITHGYAFFLVTLHELGHALGLGHDPIGNEPAGTSWFVGTMNPAYPAGGPIGDLNIVELHTDDRNGTRFLYPHTGPSDSPVVDLALANFAPGSQLGKVEPLAFSPSIIFPGEELTITSVIENFGVTSEVLVRQSFFLSTDEVIEPGDFSFGWLRWDLAFENALEFDVMVSMPDDIAAGSYFLGSIFDDLDEIAEEYEDNNVHRYCAALEVGQLVPVIESLGQDVARCGERYVGSQPSVVKPLNMAPITWSLDAPPAGMRINASSGVIRWPEPVPSPFLYAIGVRATNSAGSATATLFLGVNRALPEIAPVADEQLACGDVYVGPTPTLTNAGCMEPILNWTLDAGPDGMEIDFATGVVSWSSAAPSVEPHTVTIRATNSEGNGSQSWLLSVSTMLGDLNFSGAVDIDDLVVQLSSFGACVGDGRFDARADLDGSGCVELVDLVRLLSVFGDSCR